MNRPNEEKFAPDNPITPTGPLPGISGLKAFLRSAVLAVTALTTATPLTACQLTAKRDGGRPIVLDDAEANQELEALRKEFERLTQKARATDEEIAALLEKRDAFFRAHGLPPGTERWYVRGSSSEGPWMGIDTNTRACLNRQGCSLAKH